MNLYFYFCVEKDNLVETKALVTFKTSQYKPVAAQLVDIVRLLAVGSYNQVGAA